MDNKDATVQNLCNKLQRLLYNSTNILADNCTFSLCDTNSHSRRSNGNIQTQLDYTIRHIIENKKSGLNNILIQLLYYFSSMTVLRFMNDRNKPNINIPNLGLASQAINLAAKIGVWLASFRISISAIISTSFVSDESNDAEFATLTTSSQVNA